MDTYLPALLDSFLGNYPCHQVSARGILCPPATELAALWGLQWTHLLSSKVSVILPSQVRNLNVKVPIAHHNHTAAVATTGTQEVTLGNTRVQVQSQAFALTPGPYGRLPYSSCSEVRVMARGGGLRTGQCRGLNWSS